MKQHIKNFLNKDIRALTSISKCGICTKEQLLKDSPTQSEKRLNNYYKDGLVERVFYNTPKENITGYKLTDKGKNLLEKEFGISQHQQAHTIRHDSIIADKYFSLTDKERETFKTETELRTEFYNKLEEIKNEDYALYNEYLDAYKNGDISVCDCSYISEETEETIVFEAVTNAYGKQDIEAKIIFSTIMNYNYTSNK